MKIKQEFVLQEIVDEYIVVPVGKEADDLHGIIKLNPTGAFLWKILSDKDSTIDYLVEKLIEEYSVNRDKAVEDVYTFIKQLKDMKCIE